MASLFSQDLWQSNGLLQPRTTFVVIAITLLAVWGSAGVGEATDCQIANLAGTRTITTTVMAPTSTISTPSLELTSRRDPLRRSFFVQFNALHRLSAVPDNGIFQMNMTTASALHNRS